MGSTAHDVQLDSSAQRTRARAREGAAPLPHLFRHLRHLATWRLLVSFILVAAMVNTIAGYAAFDISQGQMRAETAARARAYASVVAYTVQRSGMVPQLLALDGGIQEFLRNPSQPRAAILDQKLARVAAQTDSADLYILDAQGLTVASSNWNRSDTFVGRNFSFRPYFKDALVGRPGQYIALGTTSKRLGYYISYPVYDRGRLAGVIVNKLGSAVLERGWAGAPDIMLVTDEDGVVQLTNRPAWRFHTLKPLNTQELVTIRSSRRYPSQELRRLPVEFHGDDAVVSSPPDAGNYIVATLPLSDGLSRIYVLASVGPIWARTARAIALMVALLTLLSAGYVIVQRRRIAAAVRLRRERHTRSILERCVTERTADLLAANRRLKEIHGELIQAAKLAALGQMSASLAHELAQPIVAIRGFAENGITLFERGRSGEVLANLREIISISGRMARVSRHLKAFSRRAPPDLDPVQVAEVVRECLTVMGGRLRDLDIEVTTRLDDSLAVMAERVRLEQVVLNLLQNACDALSLASVRQIFIAAERLTSETIITVRDTGPGLAPEVLPRLFEAFFTTKPAGEGLGLGLSISRDIVEEFGGRIEASNAPQGGAVFTVVLRSVVP